MNRQLSVAAQIAKTIRTELKKNGVQAKVIKRNHNCIDVRIYDPLPATLKEVKKYVEQFEAGSFNSMDDMYEYDSNKTGPTVEYILVQSNYSPEFRHAAEAYYDSELAGDNEPEWRKSEQISALLTGRVSSGFWASYKPRVYAAS